MVISEPPLGHLTETREIKVFHEDIKGAEGDRGIPGRRSVGYLNASFSFTPRYLDVGLYDDLEIHGLLGWR